MTRSRRSAVATATAISFLLAGVLTVGLASAVRGEEAALAPYGLGDELPALVLEDQHGQAHTLDATTKVVLFSRDMDAGKVIKAALADDGAAVLEHAAAVYISDISAMPGLVSRLFAVPAMRRRAYTMWLDREGKVTARLPAERGKATVIHLDDRRITGIDETASAGTLRAALAGAPASP